MIAHEWTWLTIADAICGTHPDKPIPYPAPPKPKDQRA